LLFGVKKLHTNTILNKNNNGSIRKWQGKYTVQGTKITARNLQRTGKKPLQIKDEIRLTAHKLLPKHEKRLDLQATTTT
jgi:hypothetical protein